MYSEYKYLHFIMDIPSWKLLFSNDIYFEKILASRCTVSSVKGSNLLTGDLASSSETDKNQV